MAPLNCNASLGFYYQSVKPNPNKYLANSLFLVMIPAANLKLAYPFREGLFV
ncbi:uncharacterized protein METZ01_LOCUS381390, partial [marine metagenome]